MGVVEMQRQMRRGHWGMTGNELRGRGGMAGRGVVGRMTRDS